jgi:hypothetical protein
VNVRAVLTRWVFLLALPALLWARDAREQQRIDYLIQSFASLKGATFIRNGTEHDAATARDHLQTKLRYAGERVKTAEQFIKYCATESSLTHQPYKIRFSDGKVTTTATFFAEKLKEFDQPSQ